MTDRDTVERVATELTRYPRLAVGSLMVEASALLRALLARAEQAERERNALRDRLDGWERTMSEALNSGDGSYRP